MFCMNCGQELPEGAKFCMKCGTNLGQVSPVGTINIDGNHSLVPAMCPNCNAHMKVDSGYKIARCETCGTECLVQDAIKALTVKGNVQVGSATINVSSTDISSLLQRVEILLEDGYFPMAKKRLDDILDLDPTNATAYFFLLMVDSRCRNRSDLASQDRSCFPDNPDGIKLIQENPNYIKVMKYGDDKLKAELKEYIRIRNDRIENRQKNPKKGDVIFFGTKDYPLYWKVIDIKDQTAFVVSNKSVGSLHFDDPGTTNVWKDCSLRKWLNNDFIDARFTREEKERIITWKVFTPRYGMKEGDTTDDSIFLLSAEEVDFWFPDEEARMSINKNHGRWWLRSPAYRSNEALIVYSDGEVQRSSGSYGCNVRAECDVFPFMWIKL